MYCDEGDLAGVTLSWERKERRHTAGSKGGETYIGRREERTPAPSSHPVPRDLTESYLLSVAGY